MVKKLPDTLSMRVRHLRAKAGLTQKQLGEQSGVGTTTIGDIEREGITSNPSVSTIEKLAKAFNVTPSALIGWSELVASEKPVLDMLVAKYFSTKTDCREMFCSFVKMFWPQLHKDFETRVCQPEPGKSKGGGGSMVVTKKANAGY